MRSVVPRCILVPKLELATDEADLEAFFKAAADGDLKQVKSFISKVADPKLLLSARDEGDKTALHRAAQQNHKEVVEYLLAKGADVDVEGRNRLLINLGAVEYLSSSAIGALIVVRKKARSRQGVVKLCNLQPDIHTMFTITRMDQLFDIRSSEEDALKAFS